MENKIKLRYQKHIERNKKLNKQINKKKKAKKINYDLALKGHHKALLRI